MLQFWLNYFTLLILPLFIISGTIHLLSYDNVHFDSIRSTLLPDGNCPAPCFAGIHPGSDLMLSALQSLESNSWIATAQYIEEYTSSEYVTEQRIDWEWSFKQPSFLPWQGYAHINRQGIVDFIELPTAITFGEIQIALGYPEQGRVDNVYHYAWYPEYGFFVRTQKNCRQLATEYVTIFYMNWEPPDSDYSYKFVREHSC